MNKARIHQIAQERRAQVARLTPLIREHRQAADALLDGKASALATIQDRKTVVENIRVIPGFFPTPADLAERMVYLSRPFTGATYLEPSAGAGAIAEAIRAEGFEPFCIEFSSTLAEILVRKGFNTLRADFLEFSVQTFDRIVMNPPFENGQDIDHTRHAFSLLNPGGRLVGITSAGAFYRSDKKATAFREWLDGLGGWSEQLPAGTFQASGTNVVSRLIVIDNR
jgi:hypothetical protein